MKNKVILGFAALLWVVISLPVQAEELKIAVIDLQRALNQVEAGKEAKEKLEAQFKTIKDDLAKTEQELKETKENLESQVGVLNEEALKAKGTEFTKQLRDYQMKRQDLQTKLRQEEEKFTREILDGLQEIVAEMGQKEKYTLILDQSTVLFGKNQLNLTEQIIKEYNKRHKAKS